MIEFPDIDVTPLVDERGHVILFDLWVSGRWVGSRRTTVQCEEALTWIIGMPIEAVPGTAW